MRSPDDFNDPAGTPPRQILTPSSLNRLVRGLLEDALPLVWIEGELSNVARPASGHIYFTLKDSDAQVRCAMFRPKTARLTFKPGCTSMPKVGCAPHSAPVSSYWIGS